MSKLFSKRRAAFLILFVFAVGLFFIPVGAQADSIGDIVVLGLGKLVQIAVEFLGKILIAVIDMLVQVAQYNDFGDSAAVNIGWVVTRDLANMLFIIALIVISFGTILQWEQYRYNRLLGKLVLTVILVNFSKAISLFLIDFSQVIMLTFVNAFRDVAAGNLTTGFGIRALLAYADSSTSVDINVTSTVLVYALAIVLILIALIVTISLVVILVRRIISLWIIIILAPLAFIASIMPGGVGSYNAGWWKRLGQEMFVGPALAFFLWLSFSIIFLTSGQGVQETATIVSLDAEGTVLEDNTDVQATVSQIGSTANLFNFVAVIVLLIHSMTIAQQAGGFAGKFASRASGWIDQGGSKLVKGIGRAPKKLSDFTGVTGVAKRAGFAMADKGLGALNRIPVVGGKYSPFKGKIRRTRAKLNERRDRIDPDSMRYIRSLSNEELGEMTAGTPSTLTGVREMRGATEELMRRHKDFYIPNKGMRKYLKAIGYSVKPVLQDPTKPWDEKNNPVIGNEENARNRDALELVFGSRERVPRLYDAMYGPKPSAMERQASDVEYATDLSKMNKNAFNNTLPEGLQKDPAREDPGSSTARRTAQMHRELEKRSDVSPKFEEDTMRDAIDAVRYVMTHGGMPYPANNKEKLDQAAEHEPRVRKRLGIEDPDIDPQVVANLAQQRSKQETPLDNPSNLAYIAEINSRMKDLDEKKRAKIAQEYKSYAKTTEFVDDDGKYDAEAYRQALARRGGATSPLADVSEEARQFSPEDQEAAPDFVGGKDPLRRLAAEQKRAQEQGRASTARFAANLSRLGLDESFAGANLEGAEKDRVADELAKMYQEELEKGEELTGEEIQNQVTQFSDAIKKSQYLAIANTKRKGYSLGHVLRHENAHAEVEKLSDQEKEDTFGILDPAEQQKIIEDITGRWKLDNVPDDEKRKRAIEEYLTEGLANYGRSDAVGSELDSDLALAMKRRGVKFRAYTNLEQAAPQAETSVPVDLYNASLQRYEKFATSPTLSDEDYDRYFEDEIKKGTLLESRKMRAQAVRDEQTVRLQGVSAEQPSVMPGEQQAAQAEKIPDEELSTKAVSDFQLRRMNWMAQKKAQAKTALQSGTGWIQKELSEFLGDQKLAFYEGTGVKTLMDGTKAGLQKLLDKRREFFAKRKADRTNEPLRQSREAVDAYSQETAPIHMDQLRKRRSDAQQKHDEASGTLANLKEEERRIQRDIAEYNKQATSAAQAGNLDKAREFGVQAREGQNNLGQVKESIKSTERTVAQTQEELTEAQEAEKSAMGNLFASTDKLSKRFDAIAASLPEDGLKNLSSLAGQELEDLNVQSLESAWSGDIESAKRFQEQANGFVIARKRIESTMQSRVTPPESVPPSRAATQPVSRETLEADARRQETIVNGLQRQIDERVAEMQEQLPEGLHIEDLSNPNPLVAKNVSEKGVPEAFRREMQQLHETLRTESKALRDINDTLQHQIRLEKERAQETSRAIERGMKSAHQETSKIDKKAAEAAPRPNPQQNQPKSGQTPTQEQSRVPKNDTPKGPDTIA